MQENTVQHYAEKKALQADLEYITISHITMRALQVQLLPGWMWKISTLITIYLQTTMQMSVEVQSMPVKTVITSL